MRIAQVVGHGSGHLKTPARYLLSSVQPAKVRKITFLPWVKPHRLQYGSWWARRPPLLARRLSACSVSPRVARAMLTLLMDGTSASHPCNAVCLLAEGIHGVVVNIIELITSKWLLNMQQATQSLKLDPSPTPVLVLHPYLPVSTEWLRTTRRKCASLQCV